LTGSTPRRGRDVSRETPRPGAAHDDLVRLIVNWARRAGAVAHHCRDARYCDGAGLPDVIMAGIGGVAFIEVKTGSGEPRPEQNDWLGTLRASGALVMVCGPGDLADVDELITNLVTWPPRAPVSG
jgi:hypothetical protein